METTVESSCKSITSWRADSGVSRNRLRREYYRRVVVFLVIAATFVSNSKSQYVQQGSKYVPSGAVGSPYFGQALAISADGNTAIFGGYGDNSLVGAAWVYTKSNGIWSQQGAKLVATGAVGASQQGRSIALSADGNTAVIGAPSDSSYHGAAWVWTRSGSVWTQTKKLYGTGNFNAAFEGSSVAISADGNTIAVGGSSDYPHGAVWIWSKSYGVWIQQGTKLVGTGAIDTSVGLGGSQGGSVALSADGNTLIEGSSDDSANVGAVWVWTRSNGVWSQEGSKLVGSGKVGISGQGSYVSISGDGNTAFVSGINDNNTAGAVWVWTRSNGVWTQQGNKLVPSGIVGPLYFGNNVSVSSDGNTIAIGGPLQNGVWMFTRANNVWTQQGSAVSGTGAGSNPYQGYAVAISADNSTMIESGYYDNNIGAFWSFSYHGDPNITAVSDVPSDQGGKVRITWNKSFNDTAGAAHPIVSYGLWRLVPAGGVAVKSPVLSIDKIMRVMGGQTYDYVAEIPATQFSAYSYVAPTLTDSASTGIHEYTYIVAAYTQDPSLFYLSQADSGYSVDNIPPLAPGSPVLTPLANGPMELSWLKDRTDPDVSHYDIYRSLTAGFNVSGATLIASTRDTLFVDSSAEAGQTYYYRLTTVDLHDNQSIPSAQLGNTSLALELSSLKAVLVGPDGVMISWTTASENNVYEYSIQRRGDGDPVFQDIANSFIKAHGTSAELQTYAFEDRSAPQGLVWYRVKQTDAGGAVRFSAAVQVMVQSTEVAPVVFQLSQNYPNPFNPTTEIKFSVAEEGRALIEVYNTLGQRIATIFDGSVHAGQYYRAYLDGSELPSGIYFSRLTAGGKQMLRKMVLLK